jgi:eukaryotic-like serine/threonine-protein kinase
MPREAPIEQRLLGQTLAGKYKLVEVQACGAFGTVFHAHQSFCRQFVRPVAVKVSRQTGLTEETAPYLFGDALVLARLLAGSDSSHDNGRRHLVHIYDMGLLPEHDDRAFLVMEYVDGLPLISHMHAAGRISVATGLRLIKQICRGLALVHAQGAVHRDLKPDNVLVDRRGVVRVVDFGLAAFADPRLGFAPGSLGTFTYMAPETLQGKSTPASDVYGLGLLMYELFTGGGPHLSAPWNTSDEDRDHRDEHLRLKQSLRFPPPSEVQNEIRFDHRWLDPLILRCLDVEPARRFADAGVLLSALEACEVDGESALANFPPGETPHGHPAPPATSQPPHRPAAPPPDETDTLFREVRRLLAARAYDQVIDRLDVHRPPEWVAVDLAGARTLRALGQAYLGLGDLPSARDCLEQLRSTQHERPLLGGPEYAAALSDLIKCYRALGQPDLARARQEEARGLL